MLTTSGENLSNLPLLTETLLQMEFSMYVSMNIDII